MATLMELYEDRCSALGIKPKVRRFNNAERRAKAIASSATDIYALIDIDGHLYYFIKVADNMAYPSILTEDESRELGYIHTLGGIDK